VLSVTSVADGKRVKVKLALEGQGHRINRGAPSHNEARRSDLEFCDAGHTLEFLCRPGRKFHVYDDDDDDDDDELEPGPVPSPEDVDA
jgi:hypothetical protein